MDFERLFAAVEDSVEKALCEKTQANETNLLERLKKAKELGLPAEEVSYCPMMDEGMGKVDIGLIDNDLRYDVYEVRASTTTDAGTLNLYYQPAYL